MIGDLVHKVIGLTPAILVLIATLMMVNAVAAGAPVIREAYYAGWMLAAAAGLHYLRLLVERVK